MIRLFKDLKIKYYLTEIIGIVAILLLNYLIYYKTGNYTIYTILVFINLGYVIFIARIYMKKALNRTINLQNNVINNTDLENTIIAFEKILPRAKNKKLETILLISLSDLYVNTAQTKKALKLYSKKPVFAKGPVGEQNRLLYLKGLCEVCIREKKYDLAKENLSILKRLIENTNFDVENKKIINNVYTDLIVELSLSTKKKKDYKEIEEYYLKRFEEETNNAKKVFIAYQLSKYYKTIGKKRPQKKYSTFYKENRGELKFD